MPVDGQDYYYDEEFWQGPNVTFLMQARPSYADFELAYPEQDGADLIYGMVGGDVLNARLANPLATENTCAVKVSYALNHSGVVIPSIQSTALHPGTLKGADDKYYFLNTKALQKWLEKTFGTTPNEDLIILTPEEGEILTGDDFGDSDKRGIFINIWKAEYQNIATGHSDIFNGSRCDDGCHFNKAEKIYLWVLH